MLGLDMNISLGQPSQEEIVQFQNKDSLETREMVSSEMLVERNPDTEESKDKGREESRTKIEQEQNRLTRLAMELMGEFVNGTKKVKHLR